MRTMRLAGLLALCEVLAIGTPEAQAKKGGKGNKHHGGVVGLPPGQAKKLYGYAPSYTYPTPVSGGYVSQGSSQESYMEQGGYGVPSPSYYGQGGYDQSRGYGNYGVGTYDPVGPSSFYQPTRPSGGRVDSDLAVPGIFPAQPLPIPLTLIGKNETIACNPVDRRPATLQGHAASLSPWAIAARWTRRKPTESRGF
jgi:hypothetical protein